MTVSNKRKSMKKRNKNKLSKKSKKNKTKKINNRLQNKQIGGVDGDKKYKYNHCEYEDEYNIKECCIECNLNYMVDFYNKNHRIILNELAIQNNIYSSRNIKNMAETDKKEIFYMGYLYPDNPELSLCLFIKGERLAEVLSTDYRTRDVDIYKLSLELVTDLVNNNFLPIEYAPPGYSPPEPEPVPEPVPVPEPEPEPVINKNLKKNKKTRFWKRLFRS